MIIGKFFFCYFFCFWGVGVGGGGDVVMCGVFTISRENINN